MHTQKQCTTKRSSWGLPYCLWSLNDPGCTSGVPSLWSASDASTPDACSKRMNDHFPGETGLASIYWSKGWWRWWWQLDYWSNKSCKAPVKSSPPTNQHPVLLQTGCPSCRPTNSVKALKGKYHIPWTCLPQAHLGIFQLCLWPLIAPGNLGRGLPWLSWALWCQYPSTNEWMTATSFLQ